ncbi:MAG: hypothetical protein ACKVHP_03750 [Verrucomicrobiales bacterium]
MNEVIASYPPSIEPNPERLHIKWPLVKVYNSLLTTGLQIKGDGTIKLHEEQKKILGLNERLSGEVGAVFSRFHQELMEMEAFNAKVVSDENGDQAIHVSYDPSAQEQLYQRLKSELVNYLGPERSNVLLDITKAESFFSRNASRVRLWIATDEHEEDNSLITEVLDNSGKIRTESISWSPHFVRETRFAHLLSLSSWQTHWNKNSPVVR